MTRAARFLRRLIRDEAGNSTVEIVFVLPVFFIFFFAAIEGSVHSIRQVMLDRAVDLTVRDVRVGFVKNPTHEKLTERMCDYALIIPACSRALRLEMTVNDPRAWAAPSNAIACRDIEEDNPPEITLANGANNQLMLLRACAVFTPVIPGGGVGRALLLDEGKTYALTATQAYVLEPFQ